jgi:hypothetical protein
MIPKLGLSLATLAIIAVERSLMPTIVHTLVIERKQNLVISLALQILHPRFFHFKEEEHVG